MTLPKVDTPIGHAMPPAEKHAITVHMPKWDLLEIFVKDPPAMVKTFKSIYPRMKPHDDIMKLTGEIIKISSGVEGKACLLFSSLQSAQECQEYACSPSRSKIYDWNEVDAANPPPEVVPCKPEDVSVRVYEAESRIYAVFFPATVMFMGGFWMHAGVGISSRMAEANLKYVSQLKEITEEAVEQLDRPCFDSPSNVAIRERIAEMLRRAPSDPSNVSKATAEDVFLYTTGMASIFKLHSYLLHKFNQPSILFGMAFHSTPHVFEEWGPGSKFFGLGTDDDLDRLEKYLDNERISKRPVQAIFAEFPTNPNLETPNIERLRALSDKHNTLLIIDDTISGFANVDLLPYTDILMTSLTKAFSGYADVMAGSLILNPASRNYTALKEMFTSKYIPEYHHLDAEVLLRNSNNYLARNTIYNTNAHNITTYLHEHMSTHNDSPITRVFYTPYLSSKVNYDSFKRSKTQDYEPGYGCLFSIEFASMAATKAFYDALNVHCGPHLGAHRTLALPYVAAIYGAARMINWVKPFGLKSEQIRISVGLEDPEGLLEDFKIAVEAAMEARRKELVA